MILGIVAIVFTVCCGLGFLAGIASIILGRLAQKEIEAAQGAQGGRGMATAGFWLGIVSLVLAVLYGVLLGLGVLDYNFDTSP
jgi:hypothetical protein